jgi:GTPase SAR1 family protein
VAQARKITHEYTKFILVAAKSDLHEERVVSEREGRKFAKKNGIPYIETSAKSNLNIDVCFQELTELVFDSEVLREHSKIIKYVKQEKCTIV